MNIEGIKKIFNVKREVHFKLYSLDYTIKEENDTILVYPDLYKSKKENYNTLDEVLNYFMIYNESIIENQDRIMNIR